MIHYHGTPLSGDATTAIRALARRHACVSFAAPKQLEIAAEVCQSFIVDNGAFSTWKTGKKYDVAAYADFISEWYRHPAFDWYMIPDAINGGSSENIKLRGRWRELVDSSVYSYGVPVWHLDEPLEELSYLALAYNRICLGSAGEYANVGDHKWFGRMQEVMQTICDEKGRPKVKLHMLRGLDPTIFSQFPFASADSTNVARNIGICSAWKGTYQPRTKEVRAEIMMDRIEHHASSNKWNAGIVGGRNMELFG